MYTSVPVRWLAGWALSVVGVECVAITTFLPLIQKCHAIKIIRYIVTNRDTLSSANIGFSRFIQAKLSNI